MELNFKSENASQCLVGNQSLGSTYNSRRITFRQSLPLQLTQLYHCLPPSLYRYPRIIIILSVKEPLLLCYLSVENLTTAILTESHQFLSGPSSSVCHQPCSLPTPTILHTQPFSLWFHTNSPAKECTQPRDEAIADCTVLCSIAWVA